jgi:hypothetical protein
MPYVNTEAMQVFLDRFAGFPTAEAALRALGASA